MRKLMMTTMALAALSTGTAQARSGYEPVTNREPDMEDVAKTPITDLNLSRDEIPSLLIEAQARPYSLLGLSDCARLMKAVGEFDAVLGPDLDLPQTERSRFSEGRIAQWVVGSFIPFRGLIREISGANRQQRKLLAAIQAGLVRRGFLKGVGAARGCPYPASPATPEIVAQYEARLDADAKADESASAQEGKGAAPVSAAAPAPAPAPAAPPIPAQQGVTYTSQPVIQPTKR